MNRDQQRNGDAEAEHPAERGKQRHEQVIEGEDLIAQHGQAIEILRSFVMFDGGNTRLQSGDV